MNVQSKKNDFQYATCEAKRKENRKEKGISFFKASSKKKGGEDESVSKDAGVFVIFNLKIQHTK